MVVRAKGVHPIPSRTRKLSPSASMVLHGRPCGRVDRRQPFILTKARITSCDSGFCRFLGSFTRSALPCALSRGPVPFLVLPCRDKDDFACSTSQAQLTTRLPLVDLLHHTLARRSRGPFHFPLEIPLRQGTYQPLDPRIRMTFSNRLIFAF